MVKILKSEKGSVLTMVLVVFTVLSILGVAILPLAVVNYKMKVVDKSITSAFYKAEGILEEAHAVILKEVQKAITKANEHVATNMDTFINPNKNSNTGEVNITGLQDAMGRAFVKEYKKYINGELKNAIKDNSYKANGLTLDDSVVVVEDSFNPDSYSDSDVFSVIVTASYVENNITKSISRRFTVKSDSTLIQLNGTEYLYPEPYLFNTANYNLKENTALNTRVLTAGNGIELNGQVTIEGNIFSVDDDIQIKQGATVNTKNGSTIATRKDIIIESNATLISKGDVYCNSLLVPESTNNAKITIGEDADNKRFRLITKDDLELNGTKSHITIHGSYYGFTSDNGTDHRGSSAIIINSRDIGNGIDNGSSLFISGEPSAKDFEIPGADGNPVSSNGIYVGGTAYIDVKKKVGEAFVNSEYQTGESVSLPGNYIAYTDQVQLGDGYDSLEYKQYWYNIDGSYHPFNLATNKQGESTDLTLADKKNMLSNAYSRYRDTFFFNTADTHSLILNNFKYSTGSYVSGGTINDAISGIEIFYNVRGKIKAAYDTETTFIDVSSIKPTPSVKIDRTEEICYIGDKTVVIKGINAPGISLDTDFEVFNPTNAFKGIIVTDGDVILAGNIDFTGIIASAGKVIFYNDGESKIIHHDNIAIYDDESATINTNVLDYRRYQHLVEVSDWKIER